MASIIAKATGGPLGNEQKIQQSVIAIVHVLTGFANRSIQLQGDQAIVVRGESVSLTVVKSADEGFPMIVKSINFDTLQAWLWHDTTILIDVREADEHEKQNILGDILIPLKELSTDILPQAYEKHIVIYCRSGRRSLEACKDLLATAPWLDVYNLDGGIMEAFQIPS